MNRLFLILSMALIGAMLLIGSCVVPPSGGSGATTGGSQKRVAIMTVNNRPVYADELLKSYMLRSILRQFLMLDAIKAEAAKRGIKIDETEVKKRLDEQKKQVTQTGGNWDEFLKQQSMTEADAEDFMRVQMMIDGLTTAMVKISPEELKSEWDKNKATYIDQYLKENKLPDSEKAKATFEKVKPTIEKSLKERQKFSKQEELFDSLTESINLSLTSIADPAERQKYEDLIINDAKKQIEDKKKAAEENKKKAAAPPPAGGGPSTTPPAGQKPSQAPPSGEKEVSGGK